MLTRITGLPVRTIGYTLPYVFSRLRIDQPLSDAAAFRDHVRRLDRPERQRTEAARLRIILTRAWRVGLRERLQGSAEHPTRV